MTPAKRLLSFLDTHGVGIFTPVNEILKEDFPANENDDYYEFSQITQKVTTLFAALQNEGLIQYRIDGFFGSRSNGQNQGYNHGVIYAAITQKGSDSLKETTQSVSTTPNSTDSPTNIKWHKTTLFKYVVWPLLVIILGIATTLILKYKFNLTAN